MDLQKEVAELIAMAKVYKKRRRFDLAAELLNTAIALQKAVNGSDRTAIAPALYQLGELYSDLGHYQEAQDLYRQAVEIWGKAHPSQTDNALYFTHSLERLQEQASRNRAEQNESTMQRENNDETAA